MMRLIPVNQEFLDYELEMIPHSVKWVAYWYEYETYEGRGSAIACFDDGLYELVDLGHCSCYGPTEHFPSAGTMTCEQIQAIRGKDYRGNELVVGEWDVDAVLGMWKALDIAEQEGLFRCP
jgi:hypothetical protein